MDIKARQEYTTPTAWNAAEMVFVDRGDGTAEMFVTSASGQPRRIVGLAVGGSNAGTPPPTDVTRTGALTSTQTYGSLAYARQRFRPTVNIPVTGVQVDQLTVSGNAAVAFHDLTTGAWVAAAAASQVGAGITATLSVLLLAGHEYFLHVGTLGSGVSGTEYTGAVSGVTFSSGHAWTGLALTAPPSVFESATPVTAGAQLAFQLLTGDMTGFDPSGVTHKAENGATIAYDGATRTYTHGVSLDLSQWGASSSALTEAWAGGTPSGFSGPTAVRFDFTAAEPLTVSRLTLAESLVAQEGATLTASLTAGGVITPLIIDRGALTPAAPLDLPAGAWSLEVQGAVSYPVWSDLAPGAVSDTGLVTYVTTYAGSPGNLIPAGGSALYAPRLTLNLGTASLYGVLPAGAVPGLGALEGRVTDLEAAAPAVTSVAGRTGEVVLASTDLADFTEAAQDAAGSMISDSTDVDAVYADGSNTLALKVTGIQNKAVPTGGAAGQALRLNASTNGWEFYDPAAGGSGLAAVSHDASLTGDGTPGNPLSVVGGGGGGGTAILGTGNTAVENPPAGTTETMQANAYGQYLELRWTALQATTLRRLTFQLRNWYGGSSTVNVAVYRTTDGSNTASAGTFVANANIPSVGGTMAAYTSVLPADLAVNPGDRLIVRLSATDGGLVEVKSRPDGQSLPYALPAGVLAYQGGAGQSDSSAVGTRVPHVTFLAQTTKNTIGPAFTVGATAERPTGSATGDQHYDTTLGKPVWWSGSAWKDASGTNA